MPCGSRTGSRCRTSSIEPQLREAEAKRLVERDFARVKPTQQGFDFLSNLQELFL